VVGVFGRTYTNDQVINYINNPRKDGGTPLMVAAIKGHSEITKLLLDKGANINQCTSNGYTALMWAASAGHNDTVRLLINQGANPMLTTVKGSSALLIAADKGNIDVVKTLLACKEIDVNSVCKNDGVSPLSCAVKINNPELVQLLLDHGAKLDPVTASQIENINKKQPLDANMTKIMAMIETSRLESQEKHTDTFETSSPNPRQR